MSRVGLMLGIFWIVVWSVILTIVFFEVVLPVCV